MEEPRRHTALRSCRRSDEDAAAPWPCCTSYDAAFARQNVRSTSRLAAAAAARAPSLHAARVAAGRASHALQYALRSLLLMLRCCQRPSLVVNRALLFRSRRSFAAAPAAAMKEIVHAHDAPAAVGPYSQAVKCKASKTRPAPSWDL
jgi:hypothetical protein